MKNFIKKISTIFILSAFIFNSNFNTIEVVYAQWDDWSYDSGANYNNVYSNPSTGYVDTSCYGCGIATGGAVYSDDYYYNTPTYSNYYDTPTYNTPTYNTPTYNTPTYNTPTYNTPTYNTPTYNTPTYNTPTYNTPVYNQPVYNQPVYTYTPPTATVQPVTYTCWNGQTVYSMANCPAQTKTCPGGSVIPVTQSCPTYYCSINGNTYNTQTEHNNNCKETTRYCALNGQTYTLSQYSQSCHKYCSYNGYYYSTQAEYNTACKAPVTLYCSLNGQTYSNQNDYAANCKKYCSLNGYYYASQSEYDGYCKNLTKTCLNGQVVTIGETCNKTCPNGSVIPETQNCQSYYCAINGNTYSSQNDYNSNCKKYCSFNGYYYTSQSEYDNYCKANTQTYYCNINGQTYYNQDTYNNYCKNVIPVNNHRAVTTIPTQITTTSGRCNGVAMIDNGVGTTGYFEYGTTQSLGYSTNQAYIGTQSNTQYSNILSGLTPSTTYYCRAVIVNKDGTFRGEIMSFRTDGVYVPYVPTPKPIIKTVYTKVKGKTVTTTKVEKGGSAELTCMDFSGKTSSINTGEKLISLEIVKSKGSLSVDNVVEYTVKYENTSRLALSNVKVKLSLPVEMSFQNKNIGVYDAADNTLTVSLGSVEALSSGEIKVLTKVNSDAEKGRTVIINGYATYEILDEKGKVMKDENTAYLVSTIDSDSTSNADTNKVKTATSGNVLPDTILEWLFVIILLMVLFILGRTIYDSLNGSDAKHH